MYCPGCGKQIEDDAKFCPHCGRDVDPTDDVPQPGAAAPSPTPTPGMPTPMPAPGTPVPPAPGLGYQPATPPPMGVPTAPGGGQPARRSSTCWIIGCILLILAVGIVGVGGFFGWKYLRGKIQQTSSSGLVINEGGGTSSGGTSGGASGETSGGVSGETSGGSTAATEAPAEAVAVVQGLFQAWAQGDVQGVVSHMSSELRDMLGGDDSPFKDSYDQISVKITNSEKISDNQWRFTVEETYRADSNSETKVTIYELEVTNSGGSEG